MKKTALFSLVAVCLTLMAFVVRPASSAEVISITDPFTNVVEVCYSLPYEGDVEITVTPAEGYGNSSQYTDKQGHGTHCAGIACARGRVGTYRVEFSFEGERQTFYIERR
jgi:subtilisin family serine protease